MRVNRKMNKSVIYLLVFLFTLHTTPATYINSSFLKQFIPAENVGYIYTIASLLTIISFFWVRKLLRKRGNFKTILTILTIEVATLLIMASSTVPAIAIGAYIIGFVSRSLIFFNLDIFLESASEDSETGGIRGYYMTFLNLAFLIGPFITSFIMTDHDFWKIYVLGAIIQIPVFYIIIKYLRNFQDPIYKKPKLWKTFLKVKENPDLYSTFASGFILRFFFSWMVVYTPIFLTTQVGFSLAQTTLIIGIALVPFVLLEILLGKISDDWLGEKEILTLGFLIMAISTSSIAFIGSTSLILWAGVLFVTRIGASMVEIMTEVHLFKRIDADNINILGLFRSVRPIAYMISPVIASILLLIMDFKYLFLVLGIIMLYGLRYSLSIKDTR
jgi:MFS family permease